MQYQRIQGSLYKSHHHHPRPRLEAPCMERLEGSRELDKSSPICSTKPGLGDWKKKPGPGDRKRLLASCIFEKSKYSSPNSFSPLQNTRHSCLSGEQSCQLSRKPIGWTIWEWTETIWEWMGNGGECGLRKRGDESSIGDKKGKNLLQLVFVSETGWEEFKSFSKLKWPSDPVEPKRECIGDTCWCTLSTGGLLRGWARVSFITLLWNPPL